MQGTIQKFGWRGVALMMAVANLTACGSPGNDPPAPVGDALSYSQTPSIENYTSSLPDAYAPGIPYGGIWLKDQASLDAFWTIPAGTTVPKPTVDFATQSLLAYAASLTAGYSLNITRVSAQQVIVSEKPGCGGGYPAIMVPRAIVVVVQGTLNAMPKFDVWKQTC